MSAIYQVWHSEDMALSDRFYPTLKEAAEEVAEYGVTERIVLDKDGYWNAPAPDGFEVHVTRHHVEMNRASICDALTSWPNR